MVELHRAYLSLGSNIDPARHLIEAVELLKKVGRVRAVSSIWESESVGFDGPNFLNACLTFMTDVPAHEFKERIIRPIESALGRVRSAEKNAPRTIDIDMVLYDEQPLNEDFWAYAFVTVPLAELVPDFIHPQRGERLARVSAALQAEVWIVKRPEVLTISFP